MSESSSQNDSLRAGLRKDLLKLVALAIPIYAVNLVVEKTGALTAEEPWLLFALVFPVPIAIWIAANVLRGKSEFALRGATLVFVLVYVLFFSVISQSDLLLRRRKVFDYEGRLPATPRFLSFPTSLGNWRYRVVSRPRPPSGLLVVQLPSGDAIETRWMIAQTLSLAKQSGARGLALDIHFEGQEALDEEVCKQLALWGPAPPIVVGVPHAVDKYRRINFLPMSSVLRQCLPKPAHVSVLPDADSVVRYVPIDMPGRRDVKSLSWMMASMIAKSGELELRAPGTRLVEFVAPALTAPRAISYEQLNASRWAEAHERYLLVGKFEEADEHPTPFGKRYGVEIHAYAVQALVEDVMIRRPGWLWTMPAILAGCYWIMLVTRQGWRLRRAVVVTALLSLGIVLIAIAAMRWGRVWLDAGYPILAWWLFLGLAAAARKASPVITTV